MEQKNKEDLYLLSKVRQKFGIFGGISMIFGAMYTFCFYKAGIGINSLIFTAAMVALLTMVWKNFGVAMGRPAIACYTAALLMGLSDAWTANGILQTFSIMGILLLLNISILYQCKAIRVWDSMGYLVGMFELLFRSIAAIGKPFTDTYHSLKKTRVLKNDRLRYILTGSLIAIPLLWLVIALLASADMLFGELTRELLGFLFSSDIVSLALMILFGFIACYCIICAAAVKADCNQSYHSKTDSSKKQADAAIAITVLSLLLIVYALFCGIQIIYLFSNGLFRLPEEFTFSEYARQGFFELLAVTAINIILMLLGTIFFKENRVLRILLTCMTICTYIMIASAAYRMLLYIGAYHLTLMRLLVLLFLVIDALVLAGVIISVYHRTFPLFGYFVAVTSICYLIFTFSKPDSYIAEYHINHMVKVEADDIIFLTQELSADAASVVIPYLSSLDGTRIDPDTMNENLLYDEARNYSSNPSDWFKSITEEYHSRIQDKAEMMGIRDFHLSYYTASKYTAKR